MYVNLKNGVPGKCALLIVGFAMLCISAVATPRGGPPRRRAMDLINAHLNEIKTGKRLTELELETCTFDAEAIQSLEKMPSLESLLISGSDMTQDSFLRLLHLKLKRLHLSGAFYGDCLKGIGTMSSLKELYFDCREPPIPPQYTTLIADAVHLRNLGSLESLHLSIYHGKHVCTDFQELELTPSSFKSLRSLSIQDIEILDFKELSILPSLRSLRYSKSGNSDLKNISFLKSMTSLSLANVSVTPEGMQEMSTLKTLEDLHLRRVSLSSYSELRDLRVLKALRLDECRIDAEGLKHLSRLKSLTTLEFRLCGDITAADLQSLRKAMPHCDIRK